MVGRLVDLVSFLLLPLCSRRLDHRLSITHPQLWRSRLLPAAWFAALTTIAVVALAHGAELTTEDVWHGTLVNDSVAWLAYALVGCAMVWARVVMVQVVGPLAGPARLQVVAFNMLALFLILVPAYALDAVLARRVAAFMPNAEWAGHRTLHESNAYWKCMPNEAQAVVDRELVHLKDSLSRFGLTTKGAMSRCRISSAEKDPRCEKNDQCLEMFDQDKQVDIDVLEARFRSIRESKERWSAVTLSTWFPNHSVLLVQLGVSLAMALGLSLPGVDRQGLSLGERVRGLVTRTLPNWPSWLRLPAFTRVPLRRLLATLPLAWVNGLPIVMVEAVLLALLLVLVLVVSALGWRSAGSVVIVMAYLAPIQLVWWAFAMQLRPVPMVTYRQISALVGWVFVNVFALAVLPLIALYLSSTMVDGETRTQAFKTLIVPALISLAVCFVAIPARLIATVAGALYALRVVFVSLLLQVIVYMASGTALLVAFFILAVILLWIIQAKGAFSSNLGLLAAFNVTCAPAAFAVAQVGTVAAAALIEKVFSNAAVWLAVMVLPFVLILAVFWAALVVSLAALERWRQSPVAR